MAEKLECHETPALLQIDGLCAGYGDSAILHDLTLQVAPGEVLGIVGASGSGKSTLLKAIMGIRETGLIRRAGTIRFDGHDLYACTAEEYRRLRGTEMGIVFQHAGASLNPTRRIRTQFAEAMRAHGTYADAEITERAAELLHRMGFTDADHILDAYPFALSGGMAQRAAIALALALRPRLLLADEPTSALDAALQRQMLQILRTLRDEDDTGMLLVTHNIGVLRHVADRAAVMKDGRIIEQGVTDDLLAHPQCADTQHLLAAVPRIGDPSPSSSRTQISSPKSTSCTKPPLLRFENVSMHFDGDTARTQAVDAMTFSLYERERLGLVGASGSGKTTAAKLLTGLLTPTGGRILLAGKNVVGASGRVRKELCRRIQMVFQDAHGSFNPRRSIGAAIRETICNLCPSDTHSVDRRVAALLDEVELPASYAARYPHEVSGGECQRAAIARAMAVSPDILICDEATSALDTCVQEKIITLLRRLQKEHGMSLLFISHDLPLVSSITDRILILRQGRIIEQGKTADILRAPHESDTKELLHAVL